MLTINLILLFGAVFLLLYLFCPHLDMWLYRAKRYAKKEGKLCALTFDDGPSEWTGGILETLKKENIKATFFITGERAKEHPEILQRIANEGHDIGNHTMTHIKLPFSPKKTIHKEIIDCSVIIKSITSRWPVLFRAPHGFRRIGLKKILANMNLQLIPWTKGLWDTDKTTKDRLITRLQKKFQNLEILLLHDGIDNRNIPQDRTATVEALPSIIDEYRKRNYKFVSISELNNKLNK